MSLAAVCFDLDDTLYEYHQYARSGLLAAADRLERQTGESFHDELHDLYFDESVTEGTFDRLVARHDLDPDVVDELIEAFHAASAPLDPYDETEAVLSRLADRYELGLVTDGRGGRAKLRRLGLSAYFDAVVVSPEIGSSKHQHDVFQCVLSQLDGPASAMAYVGDDPRVDFRVPNRLGMDTVRLKRGRYTDLDPSEPADAPDEEIESLDELLAILA